MQPIMFVFYHCLLIHEEERQQRIKIKESEKQFLRLLYTELTTSDGNTVCYS